MPGLTPKQLRILDYAYDFNKQHGYMPTYKEISAAIGVSTITIFEHLNAIEMKGYIKRERHMARSMEITNREYLIKKGVNMPVSDILKDIADCVDKASKVEGGEVVIRMPLAVVAEIKRLTSVKVETLPQVTLQPAP